MAVRISRYNVRTIKPVYVGLLIGDFLFMHDAAFSLLHFLQEFER